MNPDAEYLACAYHDVYELEKELSDDEVEYARFIAKKKWGVPEHHKLMNDYGHRTVARRTNV